MDCSRLRVQGCPTYEVSLAGGWKHNAPRMIGLDDNDGEGGYCDEPWSTPGEMQRALRGTHRCPDRIGYVLQRKLASPTMH